MKATAEFFRKWVVELEKKFVTGRVKYILFGLFQLLSVQCGRSAILGTGRDTRKEQKV